MPASGSGESEAGAGLVHCPRCGARVATTDRFCRSCGAEQPSEQRPPAQGDETEHLTGSPGEAEGLEPPTEESTRTEPPTERQPHAEETEALPPAPAASGAASARPAEPMARTVEPMARTVEPMARTVEPLPGAFEPPPRVEPKPGRSGRRLIAVAVAVALGAAVGLVAVIAINGGQSGSQAQSTATDKTAASPLDPVESLRRHFDLLGQGRFLAASDDLTPELLDSLGGKAIWVSGRIADLVIDAQLDASVIEESGTIATVQVNSLRTDSLINGCTDFTGTYGMVRSGDVWLIDSADLIGTLC